MIRKFIAVIFIFVFVSLFVLIGPIVSINSINALFGLEIAINFKTWCASLWLTLLASGALLKK